jgi:hypothetical protein
VVIVCEFQSLDSVAKFVPSGLFNNKKKQAMIKTLRHENQKNWIVARGRRLLKRAFKFLLCIVPLYL